MYRNILLEFLSKKHLELSNAKYFQMTLCIIGQSNQNQLASLFENLDDINVYHIKEPRIYHKSYEFSIIENTILSMALELNEEIIIKKNELNFSMLDPFYLKDLQNAEFSSLQLTPIIDNGCIGVLLTYFNQEDVKINYKNSELLKLINDLISDLSITYLNEINSLIKPVLSTYFILKNQKYIYISDDLIPTIGAKTNVLKAKDTPYIGRINHFIEQIGIKKTTYLNYTLYYLNELTHNESNDSLHKIKGLISINDYFNDGEFTFIMISSSHLDSAIKTVDEDLQKLNLNNYHIFQINDDSIVYMFNCGIALDDLKKIKAKHNDFFITFITKDDNIKRQMDLKKIFRYLAITKEEHFVYENYLKWLEDYNLRKLKLNVELQQINKQKTYYQVISSTNMQKFTNLYLLPLNNVNNYIELENFKSISEKILEQITSFKDEKIMISLTTCSLVKRKTLELIKKIIINNTLWINVTNDQNISSVDFLKLISKYKCYNVMISCDSTIFMNLIFSSSFPLFDGLYLKDNEYKVIKNGEVGFPQTILSYAINDNKYLFMENFSPDDLDLVHDSCYYVVKSISK